MQSPPFGIIGINNNNPHHTTNPPPKQGQGQAGQLAPILAMNPTNRVGRHGGEGGGEQGEGKQSSGGAKKARAFTGDSLHPPHRPNEPDATLPARPNDADNDNDDVFVDT